MNAKAEAILKAIKGLPALELGELHRQINRIAALSDQEPGPPASISDKEFETALDEVTGCTAGKNGLRRLLDERRRDREKEQGFLETRKESPPVTEVFLFDTSAFLTLTDKEAGSERARSLLQAARRGELSLHASSITAQSLLFWPTLLTIC